MIHFRKAASEKLEKSKKLRLSLDRFVPKGKQHKVTELDVESRKKSISPCTGRRWSNNNNNNNSDSFDMKKRPRTRSIGSSPFSSSSSSSSRAKVSNVNTTSKFSEDVSMNADINLSDEISDIENKIEPFKRNSLTRKPTHSYALRKSSSPNNNNTSEEYVKIPKSEYEEIKNRVQAIESCISQEFKSIHNKENNNSLVLLVDTTINNVQNEYEKTLVESSIESTTSTDQLAKRLGKELKIRRSAEHKIIRSPSARKIGTLRRRSQEKPIK